MKLFRNGETGEANSVPFSEGGQRSTALSTLFPCCSWSTFVQSCCLRFEPQEDRPLSANHQASNELAVANKLRILMFVVELRTVSTLECVMLPGKGSPSMKMLHKFAEPASSVCMVGTLVRVKKQTVSANTVYGKECNSRHVACALCLVPPDTFCTGLTRLLRYVAMTTI